MIPSEAQAKNLWDKYNLPEPKRVHSTLIAKLAIWLAKKCEKRIPNCHINLPLLLAGALLHDIDKNISKLPGEHHPDAGIRILKEEGMWELVRLVQTHPLHAILDPSIAPTTWEEKLLYLSDKMVKYEIVGVDKRFQLWNDEHLPSPAQAILNHCYPKVKTLEQEIFSRIDILPTQVVKLA